MRSPESSRVAVSKSVTEDLAPDERGIADDVFGLWPLGTPWCVLITHKDRILDHDVLERAQDGFRRHAAPRPDMPLKVTDPQHQLGDGHRPRVQLHPEELAWGNGVAFKPSQCLLP